MKKPSKMAFFQFSTRYPRNGKNAKFTTGISRGFFWKSLFSPFWRFRREGHFWRFLRDSELFVFVFRMYFIYLDYMFFMNMYREFHVIHSCFSCVLHMHFMCELWSSHAYFPASYRVRKSYLACVVSCECSRM